MSSLGSWLTSSPRPSQTLSLRPSPNDSSITTIHPEGWPKDAPPIYSISTSKSTMPNIMVYRGVPNARNAIGEARFQRSSKTDLTLRGQPIRMKMNQWTGSFSIESPFMGQLKWKPNNPMGDSSLGLVDSAGSKVAQFKSTGLLGRGKRLEILVSCDDHLIDLIVLSGMAATAQTKAADEKDAEGIMEILLA